MITIAAATVLAGLGAGCSSSSKPATSSSTTTTSVGAIPPGAVAIGNGKLPATPVSVPMRETFRSQRRAYDAELLGLRPGQVTAAWYRMNDFWAVHFRGLKQLTGAGKCAVAALETPGGRQFVTDSPYGQDACTGFTDTALPPGSLFRCTDNTIVYKTQIPISAQGTLFAALGKEMIDGSVEGIAGRTPADTAHVPRIAPNGCYVVF